MSFPWSVPLSLQFTRNLPIGDVGEWLISFVGSFWSERVWLPANVTWDDIAPAPDKAVNYTNYTHIWYPIPLALWFIALRCAVEKVILFPFGCYLGIQHGRNYKPLHNPQLESAYRRGIRPTQYSQLAKETGYSENTIERWFRWRRKADKPSPRIVFCDATWKAILYISNFLFGFYVLWDKAWLWDIDQCYVGYPHHSVTNDVWCYYTISSALYWSLTIFQFLEERRKDFWQMFVHHVATIALLTFSWVCNLHRIGTLVILCHDLSNVCVQLAKAAKCANYQKLYYALSLMLIISWIGTRIGVYPFYIIWSTSIRAPQLLLMFPAYYIFNTLLCLLLVLHVVWTWHFIVILFSTIKNQIEDRQHAVRIRRMDRIKQKPSKHDSESTTAGTIWDGVSLQADINKHVDMAISQLVSFMKADKPDRMDLPDVDEGTEFILKIHNGYMRGLANVTRSGDQRIKYSDNKLSVQLQFQFSKLEIVYKYLVQALIINTSGEIEGSLDRFTIVFNLLIDFNNENLLFLKEFSIVDISDLRVELTSNFLVDRFVNPITQLFTNIFHETIMEVVQSNIGSAIQDAFDFANTNKNDIIQSVMLYTVFQYTQVTDIMTARYIEWRRQRPSKTSDIK